MASGIEMMMKTMGIDPVAVKETVANIGQIAVGIKQTLDRIEARQILIEKALRDAGLIRGDDAVPDSGGVAEGGDGRALPHSQQ